MTKFVMFRTEIGEFCVPAARVASVRSASGVVPLPSPQPLVAGLLHLEDRAVTVLAPFGRGEQHLLMLEAGDRRFGVLVAEVTGIVDVDDAQVGPVPEGQADELVTGVISRSGQLTMLADIDALAGLLDR